MIKNKYLFYTFVCMFAVIFCITAYKGFNSHTDNIVDQLGSVYSLDNNWYRTDNSSSQYSDLSKFNYDKSIGKYNTVSFHHSMPIPTLRNSNIIAIHCKNIAFNIYIGDECIYNYGMNRAPFLFGKSPGTAWHFINIPDDTSPDSDIIINATVIYNNGSESINSIYFGESSVIVKNLLTQNALPALLCIVSFIIGIAYILLDFLMKKLTPKSIGMLPIGFFAILVSIWSIMHLPIVDIFISDMQVVCLVNSLIMMVLPIPILMYIDDTQVVFNKSLLTFCYISIAANLFIQIIIYSAGLFDFQQMQWITHIIILLSGIFISYTVLKQRVFLKQKNNRNLNNQLLIFGTFSFCVLASLDMLKYYFSTSSDLSSLIRIGLLILIICVGVINVRVIYDISKRTYISSMLKKSAFLDILTGMGNRNSFEQRLEMVDNNKRTFKTVGIIVFDVNCLKYVNDTYGHQQGDQLIISCSDAIKMTFDDVGNSYRIGGDEFATIIAGDASPIKIRQLIDKFEENVKLHNNNIPEHLHLHAAVGAAFMNSYKGEAMKDIFRAADRIMYEDKVRKKDLRKN